MNYHELLQMYFERSTALQWYWTVYVLVIGGVLGFSTFRQRPELMTTVLVTIAQAMTALTTSAQAPGIETARPHTLKSLAWQPY